MSTISTALNAIVRKSDRLEEQIGNLRRKGTRYRDDPTGGRWQPVFDLYRHEDHIFVDLELPGISEEEIEVLSKPDQVVVQGIKPSLKDLPEREEIVSHREYGHFRTQFAIPPGYVFQELEQRMVSGVLHLKIGIHPEPGLTSRWR